MNLQDAHTRLNRFVDDRKIRTWAYRNAITLVTLAIISYLALFLMTLLSFLRTIHAA